MKKQIVKIAIVMNAGVFGSMVSMYLVTNSDIPMGLVASYFLTSVGLVGVGFKWMEDLLSNNFKK